MPVHAIDHVNIHANAALLAELKDFYEAALGLQAGRRPPFASRGHWLYAAGQPVLHLVEDEAVRDPRQRGTADVDHVAFSCADLPAFEERLRARGIPFRRTTVPQTSVVQLFLQDPAGNGVELQFDGGQA
jgi:catechol-2,3-dioxygenase